jgi:hypothetical protein
LITRLKIWVLNSFRQIEDVIMQDIQQVSGGGYNSSIISEVCGTDPSAGSDDFPVIEINLTGACQFGVEWESSSGLGIEIPGFSYDYTVGNIWYYYSDTLYFNTDYRIYQ